MKKIVFLNGSPRTQNSTSDYLLSIIEKNLCGQYMLESYHIASLRTDKKQTEALNALTNSDTILLAFPLYVDSLPSHLIAFLQLWETRLHTIQTKPSPHLFVLSHNGFIEGSQNQHAIDILRHFCSRTPMTWGLGIGLGGSEFMKNSQTMPPQSKVKRQSFKVLDLLATQLTHPSLIDAPHIFVSPQMNKRVFQWMCSVFWLLQARKKGTNILRLGAKPYQDKGNS
ncbi:MAG: hypothetical protein ACRCTE_00145 [Cellulosilyticaceae bacterium]